MRRAHSQHGWGPPVSSSPADREFRLALWKIHILSHAESRPIYGLRMLQELASNGHRVSPGTLYPLLARMEKHGWLRRAGDAPHARARQSFRITAEGRRLLEVLRTEVTALYHEIVLGRTSAARSRPGAAQSRASSRREKN